MVRQQALNMEKLLEDVRDFTIYYSYKGRELPYYVHGWEELYLRSKPMERVVHFLDQLSRRTEDVKKKFGDGRRSEIQYLANEMRIEDLIEEEDVVITVSHLGYIKRTSAAEYRSQRRGGRGAMGGRTRQEDFIEHLFVASTHHTLLFFTEKGRCYWLKVYEIPETDRNAKGRAIQNLIQIPQDDKIRTIIDVPQRSSEWSW